MTAEVLTVIEIATALIIFLLVVVLILQANKKTKKESRMREEEAKYKMYEIAVLNDLNDKIGYSLDVQGIAETIIGSLNQFIDYSVASYILLFPEKIVFKAHLEKVVSRKFIDTVKEKMIDSASLILNANLKSIRLEETINGATVNEKSNQPVKSFFNIPLEISGKVVGILTIADARSSFFQEVEMATLYKIVKQASQAVTTLEGVVAAENSKLNAMVASMTDGVIMTDKDFRILVVNPAAKKALGFENKKELSLIDFANGLAGKIDLKDKVEESVRIDKTFVSEEISLQNSFFKIIIAPVRDSWKSLGSVVVFRDITREKEIQRIKEDFTSMIVHELRSPLDSIKKMIEMMRATEMKKDKRAECFQMIYSSSSDMLELVNNILDVAKIEAGKFDLKKQPSDIKELIKGRILFFDIAAKDAKVNLTSLLGKDIPNNVEFDPHTISQVLNNLISNAMKFNKENGSIIVQALMHKNGESIENEAKDAGIDWFIKNDMAAVEDSLVVAVTNTGPGIAPEQIGKLFNKFFQVKTEFAQKGGTGLGLAITKSIVESHGGTVGAESIQGQGATFYFTLPINKNISN